MEINFSESEHFIDERKIIIFGKKLEEDGNTELISTLISNLKDAKVITLNNPNYETIIVIKNNLQKLKNINILEIECENLNIDIAIELFKHLKNLSEIRMINLFIDEIQLKVIEILLPLLKKKPSHIFISDYKNNEYTHSGHIFIKSSLKNKPVYDYLFSNNNEITFISIKKLKEEYLINTLSLLKDFSKVEVLEFCLCDLGNAGVLKILQFNILNKMPNLKRLSIDRDTVGAIYAELILAECIVNNNINFLRIISLISNQIKDDSVTDRLMWSLHMLPSLLVFDLSYNYLGKKTLKILRNELQNSKCTVQQLNLSHNLIGDDSIKLINQINYLSKELNICWDGNPFLNDTGDNI